MLLFDVTLGACLPQMEFCSHWNGAPWHCHGLIIATNSMKLSHPWLLCNRPEHAVDGHVFVDTCHIRVLQSEVFLEFWVAKVPCQNRHLRSRKQAYLCWAASELRQPGNYCQNAKAGDSMMPLSANGAHAVNAALLLAEARRADERPVRTCLQQRPKLTHA